MHKCANAQMHRCTNAQMLNCTNTQMLNCSTAQMHKCTNAQMRKYSTAQTRNYNCTKYKIRKSQMQMQCKKYAPTSFRYSMIMRLRRVRWTCSNVSRAFFGNSPSPCSHWSTCMWLSVLATHSKAKQSQSQLEKQLKSYAMRPYVTPSKCTNTH